MRKLMRTLLAALLAAALLCACAQAESLPGESLLALASASDPLPADYVPPTLRQISSANSGVRVVSSRAMLLREEALEPLYRMMRAASKAGQTLYVRQAYRSYADEARRFDQLSAMGRAAQKPGESSYQTGLSVTLVGEAWKTGDLTEAFAQSDEARWLSEHAAEYGFVPRYPEGKEALTGWSYEPWHYRYVGVATATAMAEQGLCLEELVALNLDFAQDMPLPEDDFDDEEPEDGPIFVADGEDDDVEWDESVWADFSEPDPGWDAEPVRQAEYTAPSVPAVRDPSTVAPEDVGPDGDYEISLDDLR